MRRHGKISFLEADFITQIFPAFIPAGIPVAFIGINVIIRAVFRLVKADVIKDEEFRLGPEIDGIGDSGIA